jgi:hypothetical protein
MGCRLLSIAIAACLAALSAVDAPPAAAVDGFSAHVDNDGNIRLPPDFRLSMVHLGSWYIPAGEASGFHDVFTEKKTVEVYRETGQFPDGATLVKELRAADVADYTTGNSVSHAAAGPKQWFVMIKDTQGRFSGNSLWGDGWGWALYKPDDPDRNVATDYKTDCLACHVPAKATDWVYTHAYPTLGGAR